MCYHLVQGVSMSVPLKIKNYITKFMLITFWLAMFAVGFVMTFYVVYMPSHVVGSSMQPALNANITSEEESGDYICINRFVRGKKNDIVAADVRWTDHTIIKRIVAVGGDKLRMEFDEEANIAYLIVNNEIVDSRNVDLSAYPYDNALSYRLFCQYRTAYLLFEPERVDEDGNILIKEDEVFLKGDNWGTSEDDTLHGPTKVSCIIGRVDIVSKGKQNKFLCIIKYIFNIFRFKA